MGYRSDVVIAFAFKTKEQIEEVMAVYRMNEKVQKHKLEANWKTHEWGDLHGLTATFNNVKWYETYDDVIGFEHMREVVEMFNEERGDVDFPYAYRFIRIGENVDDIQVDACTSEPEAYDLADELWERVGIVREISTNF